MPDIDATKLEALTRDIFIAFHVPPDDAAWIATLLVRANLRGHDSHGVIRIPHYVRGVSGVPVDDETWRQIQECAAEVGLAGRA